MGSKNSGEGFAKPLPGPVWCGVAHAECGKINALVNCGWDLSTKTWWLGNGVRDLKSRRKSHR